MNTFMVVRTCRAPWWLPFDVRSQALPPGDVTALCSNGELLLSGGIDAKIAHYARQRGSREAGRCPSGQLGPML